jgi:hypothetical protein
LGISPASEVYKPTFQNSVSILSSWASRNYSCLPRTMESTQSSETSVYILRTPGKFPKEHLLHSENGESLKTGKELITLHGHYCIWRIATATHFPSTNYGTKLDLLPFHSHARHHHWQWGTQNPSVSDEVWFHCSGWVKSQNNRFWFAEE